MWRRWRRAGGSSGSRASSVSPVGATDGARAAAAPGRAARTSEAAWAGVRRQSTTAMRPSASTPPIRSAITIRSISLVVGRRGTAVERPHASAHVSMSPGDRLRQSVCVHRVTLRSPRGLVAGVRGREEAGNRRPSDRDGRHDRSRDRCVGRARSRPGKSALGCRNAFRSFVLGKGRFGVRPCKKSPSSRGSCRLTSRPWLVPRHEAHHYGLRAFARSRPGAGARHARSLGTRRSRPALT